MQCCCLILHDVWAVLQAHQQKTKNCEGQFIQARNIGYGRARKKPGRPGGPHGAEVVIRSAICHLSYAHVLCYILLPTSRIHVCLLITINRQTQAEKYAVQIKMGNCITIGTFRFYTLRYPKMCTPNSNKVLSSQVSHKVFPLNRNYGTIRLMPPHSWEFYHGHVFWTMSVLGKFYHGQHSATNICQRRMNAGFFF